MYHIFLCFPTPYFDSRVRRALHVSPRTSLYPSSKHECVQGLVLLFMLLFHAHHSGIARVPLWSPGHVTEQSLSYTLSAG